MKWSSGLALGLVGSMAAAQTNTASQTGSSTATSSADQSSTTGSSNSDLIQSLWSGAESLLSSVYPSSSVTQVASLTWPSSVVIGGTTYAVTSASGSSTFATSASSTSATNDKPVETSAAAGNTTSTQSNNSGSDKDDKRIGIIVGVVLGCVALGLLGFMLWWVHRRNKRTGTFFRHRPRSATDSEIQNWRSPESSTSQFPEKYANISAPPPPMPLMEARHWSTGETISSDHSRSSANPFYTPHESHAELAADSSRRNSLHSIHELRGDGPRHSSNENRPSTPFSPAAMMAMAGSPVSPISPSDEYQNHGLYRPMQDYRNTFSEQPMQNNRNAFPEQSMQDYRNPFAQGPSTFQPYTHEHQPQSYNSTNSYNAHQPQAGDYASQYHHPLSHPRNVMNPFTHEDDEDDNDVFDTPPRIPTRSPKRNSSPTVHYPSGPELSTFDFGLHNGRRDWGSEDQQGDDGGDGWRRGSGPRSHELE